MDRFSENMAIIISGEGHTLVRIDLWNYDLTLESEWKALMNALQDGLVRAQQVEGKRHLIIKQDI